MLRHVDQKFTFSCYRSNARKLTPSHVVCALEIPRPAFFFRSTPFSLTFDSPQAVGIAIGFVLSPLIATILGLLIPVVVLLGLLVAAAVGYAVFALKVWGGGWKRA
jgi:hypothetical protein